MKIKMYVNWDVCTILNEKEFKEIVQRDVNHRENDNEALNEFLEDKYYLSDIFYMSEENKTLKVDYVRLEDLTLNYGTYRSEEHRLNSSHAT